jgi:hypothetical protein
MPQPRAVSSRAQELYLFMCNIRSHDEGMVICDLPNHEGYKTETTELRNSHWIKGHQRLGRFVLGQTVLCETLWGHQSTPTDVIEVLLGRYTDLERRIIGSTFVLFAGKRGKPDLTPLQKLDELEYYNTFEREVVIRGLRTYHGLSEASQYGEAYARGIIRNDSARSHSPATTQPKAATVKVERRPTQVHTQALARSTWVKSAIDHVKYSAMNSNQQEAYIISLEEEYDKSRTD